MSILDTDPAVAELAIKKAREESDQWDETLAVALLALLDRERAVQELKAMDLDNLVPSMTVDAWMTVDGSLPYGMGDHQVQVNFEGPANAAHLEGLGSHLLRNDPTRAVRSFDQALQEYERLEKRGNNHRDLSSMSRVLLLNLREVFLDEERDLAGARWCLDEAHEPSNLRDLVTARKEQTGDHDSGRLSARLLRFIRKSGR